MVFPQLSDAKANDDAISKNLMDRLRLLRSFRASPEGGKPVKAARRLGNRTETADPKGSWPWTNEENIENQDFADKSIL